MLRCLQKKSGKNRSDGETRGHNGSSRWAARHVVSWRSTLLKASVWSDGRKPFSFFLTKWLTRPADITGLGDISYEYPEFPHGAFQHPWSLQISISFSKRFALIGIERNLIFIVWLDRVQSVMWDSFCIHLQLTTLVAKTVQKFLPLIQARQDPSSSQKSNHTNWISRKRWGGKILCTSRWVMQSSLEARTFEVGFQVGIAPCAYKMPGSAIGTR